MGELGLRHLPVRVIVDGAKTKMLEEGAEVRDHHRPLAASAPDYPATPD